MAKRAKQVQGRSLWGRMLGRAPAVGKAPTGATKKAKPVTAMPTHRALAPKDKLWTLDAQTGQRVYTPITVEGVAGHWAAREWQHCGGMDGVLLVAWHERDDPRAVLRWRTLAEGDVRVVEGGAA